ncbi:MAG: glutathione S-transferase family protein [Myxococcota bacterium]|nr:glutathione S-transferase family protein [Myxococcota bacterium]
MILYGLRFSPYYERVHLLLGLKDRLDAVERVGMPAGGLRNDAYLRLNPTGKIPCLVLDDGTAIPESQVICDYLERVFPAPSLAPSDPAGRARIDLQCRLVDTALFPAMRPLLRPLAPDMDRSWIDAQLFEIIEATRCLDAFVGDGERESDGDWTLADCALVPALYYLDRLGERHACDLLSEAPRLARYAAGVSETERARESHRAMRIAQGG